MAFDFSGYVLAGGESSRMKTNKAFLESNGETFLARAADSLKIVCENRVKVVINRQQFEVFNMHFPDLKFIFDIRAERGALGGIHAALKNCETEWAFVLACDLPLVTNETIQTLTQIAAVSENISAVVPIQNDGKFQPLCAAYRVKDCLPELEEVLNEEHTPSARDFLKTIPTRFLTFDELKSTENRELLFLNVNQPSDYETLKLILKSK